MPIEAKKSNIYLTQVMLSMDSQQFILAKKLRDSVSDVVSFFTKTNDKILSNFIVHINKLNKIQSLYDLIPGVSSFYVYDNVINFDCTKRLPNDLFKSADSGIIHFSTILQRKNQNELEISVDDKLIFKNTSQQSFDIDYNQKTRFKTEFLKTFPSILNKGFILTTIDSNVCQIYLSILNPSESFVGECSKFEIINIIQRILPLWSIFDIIISDTYKIYLRKNFLPGALRNVNVPILIHAKYNIEKPNNVSINKIGESM